MIIDINNFTIEPDYMKSILFYCLYNLLPPTLILNNFEGF